MMSITVDQKRVTMPLRGGPLTAVAVHFDVRVIPDATMALTATRPAGSPTRTRWIAADTGDSPCTTGGSYDGHASSCYAVDTDGVGSAAAAAARIAELELELAALRRSTVSE